MKKFHLLVVLILIAGLSAACQETDPNGGGGDVVADRILAVAEFDGNDETIKVGGVAGAVPPGSDVVVTNQDTGETKSTVGLIDGSFDPEFEGSTDDTFLVEVFVGAELIDTTDLSVITLESLVQRDLAQLGSVPTTIKILDNRAYVVNGFSDNIQIFDIDQNPPVELDTIILPPGSDPLAMDFINDEQALVANMIGNTAAIVNLVTAECETLYTRQEGVAFEPCNEAVNLGTGRFAGPSAVAVVGNTGYVANNNLDIDAVPNGNGFVTVIDLVDDSSFTVQTNGFSSNSLTVVGDELFIINGGGFNLNLQTFEASCDPFFPPSINVLSINSNIITDTIPIPLSEVNTNVCVPNTLAATPDGTSGYLGLGLVGALLKVDLVNKEIVNGTDNPIIITDLSGLNNTADVVIDSNGIGYTSLFQSDQIAVFNTENDEVNPFPAIAPFPAGIRAFDPESQFFDGVQDLAIRPGTQGVDFMGPNIFFITGLSEQLGSVNAGILPQ
ncbi:MAG: hypothetical protein ACR2NW_04650 [Thermodesulfobacteriota bacterium]